MTTATTRQRRGSDTPARQVVRAACVIVVAAALYLLGAFDAMQRYVVDERFAFYERAPSGSLLVVEIDRKSLDELAVWPWPRGVHGALLERLMEAGANRVAYDIEFSAVSLESEDEAFETALQRFGERVYLPVVSQPHPDGTIAYAVPIPRFLRHVIPASVNVFPDTDGRVRRIGTEVAIGDVAVPAMAVALADGASISSDQIALDFGIRVLDTPRVSYIDVLRGRVDPALIRDRDVVIGATAIEMGDRLPVPLYAAVSGVFIHALGYETLAQGRALQPAGPLPVLAACALLGLAFCGVFARLTWRRSVSLLLAVGAALLGLGLWGQASFAVVIDEIPVMFVLLAQFLISVVRRIDVQLLWIWRQDQEIQRQQKVMMNVVESSFDAIMTFTLDGVIETANEAASRVFGYPQDGLVGAKVHDLIEGLSQDEHPLATQLRAGRGHVEFEARRADGTGFPIDVSTAQVSTDDQSLLVAVVRDISERKRHEQELTHQALHDALTGLPNRTLLEDRTRAAISLAERNGEPFALLLLDLNEFRVINDTLGHAIGDQLLIDVGQRVNGTLRKTDTLARFGGDMFMALLPAVTDLERAKRVASRMAASLVEPFAVGDLRLEIGGSIGIALFPEHATEAASLIKCADVAMYMAKHEKASIAVYDRAQDQNSLRNLSMAGELRQAIENDQLEYYYQPKVDLHTDRVVAFEALVRWIHPVHGFVPPDDFIGHAERTGMIGALTRWGLRTAVAQVAEWRAQGYDFAVAVNLSTGDLLEPDLPDFVTGLLTRHVVPAERLTLEITESAWMSDPDAALATIGRLRDTGVRLSIDDFGTGYSSLGYLKQLPVHELKVDKSFVLNMTEDEGDRVIVRSTIDLAHNLGLKVVAEGVEGAEHVDLLRELGCDTIQGYHLSKPLPPATLAEWLEDPLFAPRRLPDEPEIDRPAVA